MKQAIFVPKSMRFCLDDIRYQHLFLYRTKRFKKSLTKHIRDYIKAKDISEYLIFEYKTFKNSNTTVEEIRCEDMVVGIIYETRTEFNHQEVLWVFFPEALPRIKKRLSKKF